MFLHGKRYFYAASKSALTLFYFNEMVLNYEGNLILLI